MANQTSRHAGAHTAAHSAADKGGHTGHSGPALSSPLLSARTVTALKWSIAVMTLLIAAGLAALVIGMKRQADRLFARQAGEIVTISYDLPPGSVYSGLHVGADSSLWIESRTAEGITELLQLDEKGQLLRRLHLKQAE